MVAPSNTPPPSVGRVGPEGIPANDGTGDVEVLNDDDQPTGDTIRAYNPASRPLVAGERVHLSLIDGDWHALHEKGFERFRK